MRTPLAPAPPRTLTTDVCVVGGGPAGLMAGYLLARQGVEVTVLEKHSDFHRDFRGDTIHPSTLELLGELGLLDGFLALPHDEMRRAEVSFGSTRRTVADLSRLPTRCPFMVFVPQWDFLDFLARAAEALPTFRLVRETEATGLITAPVAEGLASARTSERARAGAGRQSTGRRVTGVRARSARDGGALEIHTRLVLGADGRSSLMRAATGLPLRTTGAPIDVLWMRIPRRPHEDLPLFTGGAGVLVLIDRGEYWQAAFAVPHGTIERIRERGIGFLHGRLVLARPELEDRVGSLTWNDVHPLAVRVDHLTRWHVPGLLCIGDAAHAMSPVGGVGINLAIQDAVAAARMLGPILAPRAAGPHRSAGGRAPTSRELDAVRRRRLRPALLTQRIQAGVASGAFPRTLDEVATGEPLVLRLVGALPLLRHVTGRFIGVGVRPEHARRLGVPERRPR